MSRTYGPKYDGWHPAAEIARRIRADVKAAIAAGDLPGTPRNYSVRSETYSMGQAVRLKVVGLDELWEDCNGVQRGSGAACGNYWCTHEGDGSQRHQVLTAEGERVFALLREMHAAYNHDGSDSMTDHYDVLYGGHVEMRTSRTITPE